MRLCLTRLLPIVEPRIYSGTNHINARHHFQIYRCCQATAEKGHNRRVMEATRENHRLEKREIHSSTSLLPRMGKSGWVGDWRSANLHVSTYVDTQRRRRWSLFDSDREAK